MTTGGEGPGWVLLRRDEIPDRWRSRAIEVFLVPLLPGETAEVVTGGAASPEIEAGDEPLVRLLVEGLTATQIARRLDRSTRSVQRRTAQLRDRFGAATNQDFVTFLSKRGF